MFFALTMGLVLGLSSAALGWGFYAWFGLIPLMLLSKSSDSFKAALYECSLFLFAYNLTTLFWLQGLHPLTWQGFSEIESLALTNSAWLVASLFHSLLALPFVLVLKLFYQYRADHRSHELKILDILFIAFVWLVCQHKLLLHFHVLSVPINFLAYSQYKNIYLIQIANLIGVIGLEYVIVVFNLAISNLFNVQMSNQGLAPHLKADPGNLNIKRPFFGINGPIDQLNIFSILALVLVLVYGYGFMQVKTTQDWDLNNFSKMKSFSIVQADYSAAASRSANGNATSIFNLQNQLSSKLVDRQDLLIWSEGAVPTVSKPAELNNLMQFADDFAFGTYSSTNGSYYNSIQFRDFINEDQVYNKRLLVSFGEYTPFYSLLPASLKLLANSTVGQGFAHAPQNQGLVDVKAGKIAPALCFELLFPDLIRSTVLNGADIILNLNDLSWFKGNKLTRDWVKRQFLAVAVFRAVENKRDLILAGNSGYSALINSYGKIKYQSEANKIALVQGHYSLRDGFSVYSLYGW